MSQSMFDSTKTRLSELLDNISDGKLQLPDFQRGWIWDDDRIKGLLASISRSFPIGAVMLLERGGTTKNFKPRPIEGVVTTNTEPDSLILDGQQRLTALFQSLKSGEVVETQDARTKKKLKRWYYINMVKALDPNVDREDAILSVAEDRKVLNFRGEVVEDYSTPEAEYQAHLFPLSKALNSRQWRAGYNAHWNDIKQSQFWDKFEELIIESFTHYHLPIIQLAKATPKEAVCMVFEKVNTGGVPLTVFELITATYAADDFELRKDWEKREKRFADHKILKGLPSDNFLQAVTLVSTYQHRQRVLSGENSKDDASAVGCKRKDILGLKLEDYKRYADAVTQGFIKTAKLLQHQKIFDARDLPYVTQLVPLAAVYALLEESISNRMRDQLLRWYWCGVLGELYSSSVETRFAKDVVEIMSWLQGGKEAPSTVTEADFNAQRLYTLSTRNSAAYKGISALLMQKGGRDFFTGEAIEEQLYLDSKIDIHHIFPVDWCDKNGVARQHRDSIVNKTPLSASTNRSIGSKKPSDYLSILEGKVGGQAILDKILQSHLIDPALIRRNDFYGFFDNRFQALVQQIESVMGKSIR